MKNIYNSDDKSKFVYIHLVGKDVVKIYKHYRHPITGSLANSGKIKLVNIVPIDEYEKGNYKEEF